MKAFLVKHPITFVYPLAEPEIFQKSKNTLHAYAGENNLRTAKELIRVSGRKYPVDQEDEENA